MDRAALVDHARDSIARGSKSFALASKLFDPPTRERAWLLYAWCRKCDDLADGQDMGHGMSAVADAKDRVAYIREQTDRALSGQPVDEAQTLPDGDPAADDMLIDAERTARVHTCLDTLDDPQRGAIRTAFLEGATYAELAERDGVPLGTMKSWIRRGLARLRDCMERGE